MCFNKSYLIYFILYFLSPHIVESFYSCMLVIEFIHSFHMLLLSLLTSFSLLMSFLLPNLFYFIIFICFFIPFLALFLIFIIVPILVD